MSESIMRPAIFASAFYPHIGGVEELSRQLAVHQISRGMMPAVVTMRWPKSLAQSEHVEGVQVFRHVFRVPEPRPRYVAGWAASSWLVHQRIRAELRARITDLVHVQCVSGNARYAEATARRLKVPLVVSMQGELTMDATGLYQRSSQQRRAWRRLLDHADAVTGCSQSVLNDAANAYPGEWQDRAVVVPNGVQASDFVGAQPIAHPRRYVLGIGRLVPQKGFEDLIGAFALIRDKTDVDLLIAGSGPSSGNLRALTTSLGLDDRVRFLGPTNRELTAQVFAGACAFVLPSHIEPQGIVVSESMVAGVPVLATAVGGVTETVIHGQNGLLVPPRDPASMAESLLRLLTDEHLTATLREAARRTVSDRGWEQITSRYLEVYENAQFRLRAR